MKKEEETLRVMKEEEQRRKDMLLLRNKGKGEGEDTKKETDEMLKEVKEKMQKSLMQRTFKQLRFSKA